MSKTIKQQVKALSAGHLDDVSVESSGEQPLRDKLGLALAGGGFRASLFHIGVLRRMAEMNLLRYVELISSVSGGSIVGALYVLLLKLKMTEKGGESPVLDRNDYLDIVTDLEQNFSAAVKQNLRLRLFMNPWRILKVIVTPTTLAKQMGEIYEEYIYRSVTDKLDPTNKGDGYPMKNVRPGPDKLLRGHEKFNSEAVKKGGSAATEIMINATSLNAGGRFWFTSYEVGDWYLGHYRHKEVPSLEVRRKLLEGDSDKTEDDIKRAIKKKLDDAKRQKSASEPSDPKYEIRLSKVRSLTRLKNHASFVWLYRNRKLKDESKTVPISLEELKGSGLPGALMSADLGPLRALKLSAWYVQEGYKRKPPVTGAFSVAEHLDRFWSSLHEIDGHFCNSLEDWVDANPDRIGPLLDFVIELYLLRTAKRASKDLEKDLDKLTVGQAVGASACFPPALPPYQIFGIYADSHVARLGLTDGGAYDNMGITGLMDERCTHIIASDTSGKFRQKPEASVGRLGLSLRMTNILMHDVAGLQRKMLRERRRWSEAADQPGEANEKLRRMHAANNLKGLAYFQIDSKPVSHNEGASKIDRRKIAEMRTDLDGFGDTEIAALINCGYDTADQYLHKYLGQSAYRCRCGTDWNRTPRLPYEGLNKEEAEKIVEAGRHRFMKSFRLREWRSVAATIFLGAVALYAVYRFMQATDIINIVFRYVGIAVVGVVAVGAVTLLGAYINSWLDRKDKAPTWRKMRKYIWGWKFLPFFLVAIVISVAVSAWSWIVYLCYHKPFLSKTSLSSNVRWNSPGGPVQISASANAENKSPTESA